MKKYFAKEINPEFAESCLFYRHKFEDDFLNDNFLIFGNDDYNEIVNDYYYDIKSFFEGYFIDEIDEDKIIACFGEKQKDNIGDWLRLLKEYDARLNLYDVLDQAMELLTGKKWKYVRFCGCCQREWQYACVSQEIDAQMVKYVNYAYFGLGHEFIVYESKKDFNNKENGSSIYVAEVEDLYEELGVKPKNIEIHVFNGYVQTATYKIL